MQKNKAIIICGPTASGKSYLGHYLAKISNGEIVNSDSMQVYSQMPIITASPPQHYKEEISYHLYNFLSIDQEFSVIKYVALALKQIREISDRDKLPIIIGGTGLYINSLFSGYNQVSTILPNVRKYVRALYVKIGQAEFYRQLKNLDPLAGSKLHQGDTQRILRAYEVFKQTGQSIFAFHTSQNIIPLPEFDFKVIFLYPERNFLYQMCNERLNKIFNEGAIEEVQFIKDNFSDIYTRSIKTVGVQEILAYLNNDITLNEAITIAQAKTRQYAKRQITWFKNKIQKKITLKYSNNQQFEQLIDNIDSI